MKTLQSSSIFPIVSGKMIIVPLLSVPLTATAYLRTSTTEQAAEGNPVKLKSVKYCAWNWNHIDPKWILHASWECSTDNWNNKNNQAGIGWYIVIIFGSAWFSRLSSCLQATEHVHCKGSLAARLCCMPASASQEWYPTLNLQVKNSRSAGSDPQTLSLRT